MNEFFLREPSIDEAGPLAALGAETFCDTFGHLYAEEDLQSFLRQVHSEAAVRKELLDADLQFRVLETRGALVGYIKIGRLTVPVDSPAPGAIELRQLYLRKTYIGQGLGKRMMEWAEQQFLAGGHPEVYVSVFSENARAIKFYQRAGFQFLDEYAFKVGNHLDREFIYWKKQPFL